MEKTIECDINLNDITIKDLLVIMADNRVLDTVIECEGFNIHVTIEET
jgi:hypothetical protein